MITSVQFIFYLPFNAFGVDERFVPAECRFLRLHGDDSESNWIAWICGNHLLNGLLELGNQKIIEDLEKVSILSFKNLGHS